jgi:hypothetical protein
MYGSTDAQWIWFAAIIAVAGWAVIEFVLWALGHLSWSWS